MVEQSQPTTILYGMGNALKELGPKAWEQRVQKIIDEKIIPKASPEWKARLEKHKGTIAKTTGWLVTVGELGVVAGVTIKGVQILKKRFGKGKMQDGAPGAKSVSQAPWEAAVTAGSAAWLDAQAKTTVGPGIDLELIRLGDQALQKQTLASGMRDAITKGTNGAQARDIPITLHGDYRAVAPGEVPTWLRDLSGIPMSGNRRNNIPEFLRRAMKDRANARISENAAGNIDPGNVRTWWQNRQQAGLDNRVLDAHIKERKLKTIRLAKINVYSRMTPVRIKELKAHVKDVALNKRIHQHNIDRKVRMNMMGKKAASAAEIARLRENQIGAPSTYIQRAKAGGRRWEAAHPQVSKSLSHAEVVQATRARVADKLDPLLARQRMKDAQTAYAQSKEGVWERMNNKLFTAQASAANPLRTEQRVRLAGRLQGVLRAIENNNEGVGYLVEQLVEHMDDGGRNTQVDRAKLAARLFQAIEPRGNNASESSALQQASQWVQSGMPGLQEMLSFLHLHK